MYEQTYWKVYLIYWKYKINNIIINWFQPFTFLLYKFPKKGIKWHPSDDLYCYGFSLDLTTEMYYYTYDMGTKVQE